MKHNLPQRSCVAIIPARGGSKGIPGKNLALLAGRPLISHTIQAAKAASNIDRVVVSTDCAEIAAVASADGAEVPFLRPAELARDDTPSVAAILHAVRWFEQHEDYRPDYIVLLQATSPLRTVEDVEEAIDLAVDSEAESVVSVCPTDHHPYWVKTITSDGRLSPFVEVDGEFLNRQSLSPAFVLNGSIYVIRRTTLLEKETLITNQAHAFVMPAERSLDIDDAWQLRVAEFLLHERSHEPAY